MYEHLRGRRRKKNVTTVDQELDVVVIDDNNAAGNILDMTANVPGAYVNIESDTGCENNESSYPVRNIHVFEQNRANKNVRGEINTELCEGLGLEAASSFCGDANNVRKYENNDREWKINETKTVSKTVKDDNAGESHYLDMTGTVRSGYVSMKYDKYQNVSVIDCTETMETCMNKTC